MSSMSRRTILKAGVASACSLVLPAQRAASAERDWSGAQCINLSIQRDGPRASSQVKRHPARRRTRRSAYC